MSTIFNGGRLVIPSGTNTASLPPKPGVAITVGDFLVWDGTNNWVVPISGGGALADSAANIATNFCGVALASALAADTDPGIPSFPTGTSGITVALDAIYEANVASAAFDIGATVAGVVGATGDYTVASNVTTGQIIGYVTAQYTSATTRIRVQLVGRFSPFKFSDLN